MKFILWDKKDSFSPTRGSNGEFISDGVLGKIGPDNAYIAIYANYPGATRPIELDVGQCITDVRFNLSGESGMYDIYRVE